MTIDGWKVSTNGKAPTKYTIQTTALFYAAANGKLSTVKILLKNGATSNLKDDNGETALTSACKNGHEKVATVLLEHLSSSASRR